jgi:hypothetical protein
MRAKRASNSDRPFSNTARVVASSVVIRPVGESRAFPLGTAPYFSTSRMARMRFDLMATAVPTDIAHAIQLALAPVFLLSAIAGILNVVTGRLARIIDRGRRLTEAPLSSSTLPPDKVAIELRSLERRRRLAGAAITACTLSALLLCLVIAMLFLEALLKLRLNVTWLAGVLFTSSTVALVVGLGFFLREVHLATQTMRIESESAAPKAPGAA